MRITSSPAVLVLFVAVLCIPSAHAQSMSPGSSSGSVLGRAASEDGPSLSPLRWNLVADLLTSRGWIGATPSANARIASRPSLKARRAIPKRSPFWVP